MDPQFAAGFIQARAIFGVPLDALVVGIVLGMFVLFIVWGARPSVIARHGARSAAREEDAAADPDPERRP